jgi:hypothetical protein
LILSVFLLLVLSKACLDKLSFIKKKLSERNRV